VLHGERFRQSLNLTGRSGDKSHPFNWKISGMILTRSMRSILLQSIRSDMERPKLDSTQLAYYIEETDGLSKPWLLIQLRLAKLSETKSSMPAADYAAALADIHQDLMTIGEWWTGREYEVFKP
jgi:hypothetical protein